MAEAVLFHSVLGVRPGLTGFANALRSAGHRVHVPDLFDGEVFEDLEAGIAKRDALGMQEYVRRAAAAVEALPHELVYMGWSLGCRPAQMLAQTRPGARGAVLMHGALPPQEFGKRWPAGMPLAAHASVSDPWVDHETARTLTDLTGGKLHLYAGDSHLFADPDLPEYQPAAATLLLTRVLTFLSVTQGV